MPSRGVLVKFWRSELLKGYNISKVHSIIFLRVIFDRALDRGNLNHTEWEIKIQVCPPFSTSPWLCLLPLPPLYFNFFFFEMRVHGILILIAFPLWFTLTPSPSPHLLGLPFYSWSFQSSNIRLEGKCDINTFSCSLPPSLLHSIMDVEPFFSSLAR